MRRTPARSFDHYILPTPDLAKTAGIWRGLGFRLMDHAEHQGLGTSNHVIQFDGSYFELLSYDNAPEQQRMFWQSVVSSRRGLALLSLNSPDLASDIRQIEQQGIKCGPVNHVVRPVHMADGAEDHIDSVNAIAFYPPAPLLSIFLTQHRRPHVTYSEQGRPHPNGACRTVGFVYVSPTPAAHRAYLGAFLGAPVVDKKDCLIFPTTTGTVEVMTAERLWEMYPKETLHISETVLHHPVLLRLAVTDPVYTCSFLSDKHVPWSVQGGHTLINAGHAEGVALEFVPVSYKN